MGTWGHRIFEDDYALDVREEYLGLLLDGRSTEQATEELLGDSGTLDIDEEPVFWLSLAATQWEYGRLSPKVKKEALRVIDSGLDLRRGGDAAFDKKRAAELTKLRAQLMRPQPKPKRVVNRKPKLVAGDIFRFPLERGYAFGRVLTILERAYYRFTSPRSDVALAEIVKHEVAFVVGCTDDGFYKKRWRVIGNLPLESRLAQPTWFFHQAVGSKTCDVFDIWNRDVIKTMPASECKGIEQWGAWSEVHIAERLIAVLSGKRSIYADLP